MESKLSMFQCKEDKKNLRAKVKLTVLFKNKASNLETQKHTKRIEIHQSRITNDDLLFPNRFAKIKGEKEKKAPLLQILIDVVEKHKIQRRFWHRKSGIIHKKL